MKTLLKNAKIYDGTGAAPFMGDVLIDDQFIRKVGTSIEEKADRVIDLSGKYISIWINLYIISPFWNCVIINDISK